MPEAKPGCMPICANVNAHGECGEVSDGCETKAKKTDDHTSVGGSSKMASEGSRKKTLGLVIMMGAAAAMFR